MPAPDYSVLFETERKGNTRFPIPETVRVEDGIRRDAVFTTDVEVSRQCFSRRKPNIVGKVFGPALREFRVPEDEGGEEADPQPYGNATPAKALMKASANHHAGEEDYTRNKQDFSECIIPGRVDFRHVMDSICRNLAASAETSPNERVEDALREARGVISPESSSVLNEVGGRRFAELVDKQYIEGVIGKKTQQVVKDIYLDPDCIKHYPWVRGFSPRAYKEYLDRGLAGDFEGLSDGEVKFSQILNVARKPHANDREPFSLTRSCFGKYIRNRIRAQFLTLRKELSPGTYIVFDDNIDTGLTTDNAAKLFQYGQYKLLFVYLMDTRRSSLIP